jgi:hypothetical protein
VSSSISPAEPNSSTALRQGPPDDREQHGLGEQTGASGHRRRRIERRDDRALLPRRTHAVDPAPLRLQLGQLTLHPPRVEQVLRRFVAEQGELGRQGAHRVAPRAHADDLLAASGLAAPGAVVLLDAPELVSEAAQRGELLEQPRQRR